MNEAILFHPNAERTTGVVYPELLVAIALALKKQLLDLCEHGL